MRRFKLVAPSLVILALVSSSAVMAADGNSGWYVGASAGQSNTNVDTAGIKSGVENLGLTGVVVSVDDTTTSWKLFAGYQLNQYLGFEAAYVNLGEITGSVTTNELVPIRVSASPYATVVSVVGSLPVSDAFSIFGKLGGDFWTANVKASASGYEANDKSDGLDFAYGIGAKWKFNPNVGLRAEWERFQMKDTDSDMWSLGVAYSF